MAYPPERRRLQLAPGLDEVTLVARIEAGEALLRAAGFTFVSCQLPSAPAEAQSRVRECAARVVPG
ncbi:hypothetical protein [Actinokineospora enzanensis]|uniref:hypothetical protein n=1 Tax=Actinokineospora enzanensis TaxID=155975 RepID=UPI0012EB3E02|nr:hypothetical protein [Actinokineospora enzanensis]